MDKETIIRKGIKVGDYITVICKGAKIISGTFTASDNEAVRILSAKVLRISYVEIINIEKTGGKEMFQNESQGLFYADDWKVNGKVDSSKFWDIWNKLKDNVKSVTLHIKNGSTYTIESIQPASGSDGNDWTTINGQDVYIGAIYKMELLYNEPVASNNEKDKLHLSDVALTISMREFIQGDEMFYDGFWAMMNALSLTEEYIYEIHFRYNDEVILVKELEMSHINKYFKYNGKSYELMQVSKIYVCKGTIGEVQKEEANGFLSAMSLMGMEKQIR